MSNRNNRQEFDSFADSYSALLNDNVKMFGEDGEYFQQYKIDCLKRWVVEPGDRYSILDYGCGIGTLCGRMARTFSNSNILGVDISKKSLAMASSKWANLSNLSFGVPMDIQTDFDLVVLSNVLHHIQVADRHSIFLSLKGHLKPDGQLVVFEHNPLNPLTRYVVKKCVFDADATLVSAGESATLAQKCGFHVKLKRYITFFPRYFRRLRIVEPYLGRLPIGAQYMLVLKHVSI